MDWLAGRTLDAVLGDTQAAVRREPAQVKHRVFLFQLLAVLGDWDRAMMQLNVIREMDAGALAMVHTYRSALQCEAMRAAVFAGERTPLVLGEPQRWVALSLEALRLGAQGRHGQAKELRSEAFEMAPTVPGRIEDPGDEPFTWIADADERLGPMLEAIVDGKYYWIPYAHVTSIQLDPPNDLRDFVWMPAYLRWTNGGESAGLIPTRYPGSEDSAEDLIRLAARTEWVEVAPETYQGVGQRVLTTDRAEYALMDLRHVSFGRSEPTAS